MTIPGAFTLIATLGLAAGIVASRLACVGAVLGFITGVPTGMALWAAFDRRPRSRPGEGSGINTAVERIGEGL